jgi:uncharacterized protein (DUF3820 family)
MAKEMDDNSTMPFGKHKGEKLANVPPEYLIWVYENDKTYGALRKYIEDNMITLRAEIAYKEKTKR